MKNPFNNDIDEKIQNLINTSKETLDNEASVTATSFARLNHVSEDHLHSFKNYLHSSYEKLTAEVRNLCKADLAKVRGGLLQQKTDRDQQLLDKEIENHEHERNIAQTDLAKLRLDYNWHWYYLKIALEIAFAISEVGFNSFAFSYLGTILLTSIAGAVVFSLALTIIAYYVPRHIKEKVPPHKHKRAWGIFAVAMLISLFLVASLRGLFLSGVASFHFSISSLLFSLLFTGINAVIFAAAVLLYQSFPSRIQRQQKETHKKLTDVIDNHTKTIAALRREKLHLKENTDEQLFEHFDLINRQAHYEAMVDANCKQTIAKFSTEYELKRKRAQQDLLENPKNS